MSRLRLISSVIVGITGSACSLGMGNLSSADDPAAPAPALEPNGGATAAADDSRSDEGVKLPEPAPAPVPSPATPGISCRTLVLAPSSASAVGGGQQWKNPDLARVDDEMRTEAAISGGDESQELVVAGFGANVPAGATITGLVLDIDRGGGSCVVGKKLALVVNGTERPVASIVDQVWNGASTFGGIADTWGGLTPGDVTSPAFGVVMKVAAANRRDCDGTRFGRVDAVRVQIAFCEGTK